MSPFVKSLLNAWQRNGDYAQKLVADLSEKQMVFQPQPNMNHPAWLFSHLNAYHPVLVKMLRGEPFDDPKDHPFGMLSKPVPEQDVYESKDVLIRQYAEGHQRVTDELTSGGDQALSRPMSLPRWQEPFPQVSDCLGYLMLAHEGVHLGQLSAWRRVQGLPSV